jgi:hypothetical protein
VFAHAFILTCSPRNGDKINLMGKIKLQKRYCMCGCGYEFSVWPKDSVYWFKNFFHAKDAMQLGGEAQRKAEAYFEKRESIIRDHKKFFDWAAGRSDFDPEYQ